MKRTILFLLLLSFTLPMLPQTPPILPQEGCTVWKPKILNEQKSYEELLNVFKKNSEWGQKPKPKTKRYWVVYSDRDQNLTYEQPDTHSNPCGKLSFNQKVYIARIVNNMAQVYTEPVSGITYPAISPNAISLGYVPMENLLLWEDCLLDSRHVTQKALIAWNVQETRRGETFEEYRYYHPTDKTNSDKLKMDMKFYFVMKQEGDMTLLCFQPTATQNNLFGWVKKNSYTPWSQRSCLEPNWDPKFVEAHRGQQVAIYGSEKQVGGDELTHWTFGDSHNDDKALNTKYRLPPSQLRFPVLDQPSKESNSVYCTVFSDKRGTLNDAAIYSDEGNNRFLNAKEQTQHLNVIFVVERTTEMGKYYSDIKEALKKVQKIIDSSYTLRVGTVIYGKDQGSVECVPLDKPDDARLLASLDAQKATTKLAGSNHAVALSEALKVASDASRMGYKKDQNTLILIIGSNGPSDNGTYLESEELLKRLQDNSVQVSAMMVKRDGSPSVSNFRAHVRNLIETNVNKSYAAINNRKARSQQVKMESTEGYRYNSTSGNSYFYASYLYGKQNGWLPVNAMTDCIASEINQFYKCVKVQVQELVKADNGFDFDEEFLKNKLGESFMDWKRFKAISSMNGYAQLKDAQNNSYWRYILFLTRKEFDDLLTNLGKVHDAVKEKSTNRKIFIEAVKSIVRASLGGDDEKNDKYIENMSAEDLAEHIYAAINVKTACLQYPLAYIRDKMTDEEYSSLLEIFDSKLGTLKGIRQDYRYTLDIGSTTYYWIPIEDLP